MLARTMIRAAVVVAPVLAGSSALAQRLPSDSYTDDSFTLSAGAVYQPSYEGSDDYKFGPGVVIRGRVHGFNFGSRGTQLYVDVIPETGKGLDFAVGPLVGFRANRTGGIKDPQVKALGELDRAWEIGAFAGVTKTGVVTSAYDTIGVRVSYVKDVSNAHESHVLTPSIDYGTPLSNKTYVGIGLSADFVGDGYASYYFDVSPAGAAASGLAPFSAEGGFKSWGVNVIAIQALTGDLLGGLSVGLIGSYNRLQKDFRRSPITSAVGSANQWMGAIGLAYTF